MSTQNHTFLVLLTSLWSLSALAQFPLTPAVPFNIGTPPVQGSVESAADFAELHRLQATRTKEDCDTAELQTWFDARSISGVTVGLISEAEFKVIETLASQLLETAKVESDTLKAKFNRPRPYITDPTLVPCIKKPKKADRAFPSGHALGGWLLSRVLAQIFPERAALFQTWGKQVGLNRLIGGVHHPSDVEAGWKLADLIFAELRLNHAYNAHLLNTLSDLDTLQAGSSCNDELTPLP